MDHRRNVMKYLLKCGVTIGLLLLLFRTIPFGLFSTRFGAADYGLFLGSCGLLIVSGFTGATAWWYILRTRFPELEWKGVVASHWSGMFFNSFLLSNVGGDLVRGFIIARSEGHRGFVAMSVVLDRLLGLFFLLVIGGLSFLIYFRQWLWIFGWLVLTFGGVLMLLRFMHRLAKGQDRIPRNGWTRKLQDVVEPLCRFGDSPRHLAFMLIMTWVTQVCKIWQNIFVIYAFGLAIPTFYVWFVIPLFGIVSALPISIGGLGVREMFAQGLAGPLQVSQPDLVMLSLAGHLAVVLVNSLGGIAVLLHPEQRTAFHQKTD